MAAGIGLVVKIAADTRKAVGDIHDVNNALTGTKDSTGKAGRAFDVFKSSAVPAIAAVAAGVGLAVTAMVDFGKAAWEDHQEAEKLARVLETLPGITQEMIDANEAWISTTMFATHVVDTDLREAVSKLALVTGDLDLAQQYAAASADLATVANEEYSTVVEAVESALAGKTRALMGLAPWLDTNKDKSLSAAEASAILTSETLEGKAAAEAAADPWTTISLIWDEIKEALGAFLIPLFTKLGEWFKNPENQQKIDAFIKKISQMSQEFGQKLLPALEGFVDFLMSPEFKAALSVMAREFQIMINIISTVVGWVMNLVGWIKTAMEWIGRMVGAVREFDLNNPKPSGMSGGASVSGFSTAPAGISINFYGGIHTDPEATARAITGSLAASDRRNARARGRQLEPAW